MSESLRLGEPELEVIVTPVTVGKLPAFLGLIEPILEELAGQDINDAALARLLANHAEAIVAATALGAGVERDWLDKQTPEALVSLVRAIITVNRAFFEKKILPDLPAAGEGTPNTPLTPGSSVSSGTDSVTIR